MRPQLARLAPLGVAALLILVAAGPARSAGGATYYVSPAGSDSNPGTIDAPWRTVARVNSAPLAPGDTVLFRGGASFTGTPLMPSASGSATAPITFGSYGTGDASISSGDGGAWLASGLHDLVFDGLDLSSSGAIVFASSAHGSGTHRIVLENSILHDSPFAGVLNQPQDSDWTIAHDVFRHLGDSGLIVTSPGTTITGNTIVDTGWNPALAYGKHGIYAKAPDITISYNDISYDAHGSAISLRCRDARVFGNSIHDTPYAISFFPEDPVNSGTSFVYYNKLWNISGFVFYYAGTNSDGRPAGMDLVWASNTAEMDGAEEAVNVSEIRTARVWIANSVFMGSYGSAYRGCTTCTEYHNDWYGGSRNVPSGAGDEHVRPDLTAAPWLAPSSSSSVVNTGTRTVAGISYSPDCNGGVMEYCSTAPDEGAVEYASRS